MPSLVQLPVHKCGARGRFWHLRCFVNGASGGEALIRTLLTAMFATLIGSVLVVGQGAAANKPAIVPVSFQAQAAAFSPNEMKTVGTLESGQTSQPVEYSRTPQYRAFVFQGNGHDRVEVTVTGAHGKAFIALADSTLRPIAASGSGELVATLPYRGPDIEAFYILFKDSSNAPSRLTVHLKRIPASGPPDATR